MHCRKPQVHIYTAVVALASGYRKAEHTIKFVFWLLKRKITLSELVL